MSWTTLWSHRNTRRAAAAACVGLVAVLVACGGCRAGATRGSILYADAEEALADGDTATAVRLLEDAAFAAPKEARIHYQLGVLRARAGSIEARARAERELRVAVELAPHVGRYGGALGEVLHLQGFRHEAQSTLRTALAHDPTMGRAWYVLGLELLDEYREEPTSKALRDSTLFCFESAVDAEPSFADARWKAAYLLVERGQPDRGRALARRGFAPGGCPGRWGLLLAAIEFRTGHPVAAASVFDSALACLTADVRDSILSPRVLLHGDSTLCSRCTAAERDSVVTAFWWNHDPTPASVLNERLLEHVSRFVDADFWFEVPRLQMPGHTSDRGEIYMRYGRPDFMWQEVMREYRIWAWQYDAPPVGEVFRFADIYANRTYVRIRRGAIGDFMHPGLLDVAPDRSQIDFGPRPVQWRQIVRRMRTADGNMVFELAYSFQADRDLDSLHVEFAAWGAPGHSVAHRSVLVPRRDLYAVDAHHLAGRLRLEVPVQTFEVGLQVTAQGRPQSEPDAGVHLWSIAGREPVTESAERPGGLSLSDLVPAYQISRPARGGPFDMGGYFVVPSVDAVIADGHLLLYFEIYPGTAILQAHQSLYVTYRVASSPPSSWRFRDQFNATKRARRNRQTSVESTFMVQPHAAIEPQDLAVDVHNLEPGDYAVTIEVQPYGELQRVARTLQFSIPEPQP